MEISKKVQKFLNKFISEEFVANEFYLGCLKAACDCQRKIMEKMFVEIAEDELDDHCKHLVEYAQKNGFTVPYSHKDYEKYAETCVKQLNGLKKEQEATYYIEEAIKSERDAIQSYEEALADLDLPVDFIPVILRNYYDEIEHLNKLETLKSTCVIGIDLSYCC